MKIFTFTAIAALLGACSTATTTPPTVASIGTARATSITSTGYRVTQDGVDHVLSGPGFTYSTFTNDVSFKTWSSSPTATISGSGMGTLLTNFVVAAGLDGSTYFAGISGTRNGAYPSSGTGAFLGRYAFVVNGVDYNGPIDLTADFGAGTIVDSSAGIDVNATISGHDVTGSVLIAGETSTLDGGFYHAPSTLAHPKGYEFAGVALGTNMAGVIVAK